MHSAVDIARALLANAEELGVSLSDSDLHRLAVHAQAWFMAGRERPLFGDPIIAGEDGPVIPAIREAQRNGGIVRFADGAESNPRIRYWHGITTIGMVSTTNLDVFFQRPNPLAAQVIETQIRL